MNADPIGFLSPASRIQQDSDQRSRYPHNSLFAMQFTEITKADSHGRSRRIGELR
jgi:hypothetical protein